MFYSECGKKIDATVRFRQECGAPADETVIRPSIRPPQPPPGKESSGYKFCPPR